MEKKKPTDAGGDSKDLDSWAEKYYSVAKKMIEIVLLEEVNPNKNLQIAVSFLSNKIKFDKKYHSDRFSENITVKR